MGERITTVIFDMDGTLLDTETVYGKGWLEAGLTMDQYRQLIGRSRESINELLRGFGFDPEAARSIKMDYTNRWLSQNGIPLKPGAEECLRRLHEMGIRTGLATSSSYPVAERYMVETGLWRHLDHMVSGNALAHGKPAPDIFYITARELGSPASNCMVVEDSYNGVRAGKAAGMVTVMIPDAQEVNDEMRELADAILPSLLEIPAYLEKVNGDLL